MHVSTLSDETIFGGVLKAVSRSFYLTMRVLPHNMRVPISVAYLLARAADTIADTTSLSTAARIALLEQCKLCLNDSASDEFFERLRTFAAEHPHSGEQKLLTHLDDVLRVLKQLPDADQQSIHKVVSTLISGMLFDLNYFSDGEKNIRALAGQEQLEFYTYAVAGCVGEFWTETIVRHETALKHWDLAQFSQYGVHYGKALQLTNILRDIHKDRQLGRCYLPQDALQNAHVTIDDAWSREARDKLTPLLADMIEHTLSYYEDARHYVLATPRRCLRLRLAALWPMLIGLTTLERLAAHDAWPFETIPVKVSRAWIYRMLVLSGACIASNSILDYWIRHIRKRVNNRLKALRAASRIDK